MENSEGTFLEKPPYPRTKSYSCLLLSCWVTDLNQQSCLILHHTTSHLLICSFHASEAATRWLEFASTSLERNPLQPENSGYSNYPPAVSRRSYTVCYTPGSQEPGSRLPVLHAQHPAKFIRSVMMYVDYVAENQVSMQT